MARLSRICPLDTRVPIKFGHRILVNRLPGDDASRERRARLYRAMSECVAVRLQVPSCRCLEYGEGGDLPAPGFSPFDCGER